MWNDYFLFLIVTLENQVALPDDDWVFGGESNDKLRGVIITKMVVQNETTRLM